MATGKKKKAQAVAPAPSLEMQDLLRRDTREFDRSLNFSESGVGLSTDEPENDLGRRLEHQRRAQSLTQEQLADLTKLADVAGKGLSRGVISLYELGINRPGIKEVRLLCEVLRVSPSYLIYGEEMPFQEKSRGLHFGGIADNQAEFLAKATYCLSRLDPEQSIVLVQMMMGMLRSESKGFDKIMEFRASRMFFEIANNLQEILEEKAAKKKT